MKSIIHKPMIAFLFCIILLALPSQSVGDPSLAAVGGTIAAAGAIKLMLQDLISQASEEVKAILEQAYNDISVLEATMATDLKDLEQMSMDDLDRITGERISDIDNMLQSTLSQLTLTGNLMNQNIAQQVQDAAHQSLVLWKSISKDLDKKINRIERGVAIILDSTMIQIVRIVVIIISLIIVIVGLRLIRKQKTVALFTAITGALLLIFSLTPLFPKIVSTFGAVDEEIPLNAKLPPPEIFAIRPGASLEWHQTGNLEFLGFNLLSHEGSSKLHWGTNENNMPIDHSAAIDPLKVTLPMHIITERSGSYYLKIERADGEVTPTMSLYVKKPEEISVRIDYRIWQRGQWRSTLEPKDPFKIRITKDNHSYKTTKKCYDRKYTRKYWHMDSFRKNVIKKNKLEDLQENIVNNVLQIHFCLKSGPFYDRWRGWYHADYYTSYSRSEPGTTEEMAISGNLVLYLDEETGNVSLRNTSIFAATSRLPFYEKMLGGKILARATTIEPRIETRPSAVVYPSWNQIRRRQFTLPTQVLLSTQPINRVSFKSRAGRIQLRPGLRLSSRLQNIFRDKYGRKEVNKKILLGKAPSINGFTGERTYYDALVVSRDINKSELNKTGLTPIYDNNGILVIKFETDQQNRLWINWLYVPRN